jgi:hypothetical protein
MLEVINIFSISGVRNDPKRDKRDESIEIIQIYSLFSNAFALYRQNVSQIQFSVPTMCPAMLLDALAENQSYFHGNKQAREL